MSPGRKFHLKEPWQWFSFFTAGKFYLFVQYIYVRKHLLKCICWLHNFPTIHVADSLNEGLLVVCILDLLSAIDLSKNYCFLVSSHLFSNMIQCLVAFLDQ